MSSKENQDFTDDQEICSHHNNDPLDLRNDLSLVGKCSACEVLNIDQYKLI